MGQEQDLASAVCSAVSTVHAIFPAVTLKHCCCRGNHQKAYVFVCRLGFQQLKQSELFSIFFYINRVAICLKWFVWDFDFCLWVHLILNSCECRSTLVTSGHRWNSPSRLQSSATWVSRGDLRARKIRSVRSANRNRKPRKVSGHFQQCVVITLTTGDNNYFAI